MNHVRQCPGIILIFQAEAERHRYTGVVTIHDVPCPFSIATCNLSAQARKGMPVWVVLDQNSKVLDLLPREVAVPSTPEKTSSANHSVQFSAWLTILISWFLLPIFHGQYDVALQTLWQWAAVADTTPHVYPPLKAAFSFIAEWGQTILLTILLLSFAGLWGSGRAGKVLLGLPLMLMWGIFCLMYLNVQGWQTDPDVPAAAIEVLQKWGLGGWLACVTSLHLWFSRKECCEQVDA